MKVEKSKYAFAKALKTIIKSVGESPCEKHNCELRGACAQQHLACHAFVEYVKTGYTFAPTMRPVKRAPSGIVVEYVNGDHPRPTRELYDEVFPVGSRARKNSKAKMVKVTSELEAGNARFQSGSGVYRCRCCNHNTRSTGGGGAGYRLCDFCFTLSGERNSLTDFDKLFSREAAEHAARQLDERNGAGTALRLFPDVVAALKA